MRSLSHFGLALKIVIDTSMHSDFSSPTPIDSREIAKSSDEQIMRAFGTLGSTYILKSSSSILIDGRSMIEPIRYMIPACPTNTLKKFRSFF